jgi:DNA polymerase-3 subunit gamma/tau
MYLALARKYRPQNFLELVGQDAIVKTLKNAIESSRLHHAYLFCGARGVGKTSLARILAKSINCQKGPTITPCQKCAACQSITAGNSLDVIEIDGASNNLVDDVRELREQVKYLPTDGKYKIFIIDEVHMLTNNAFNALLKTLEEPPAHVIFIFATTEPHKIPVTILSRCQKYDFKKLSLPLLTKHLMQITAQENVTADPLALNLMARCAQGSVRDALSLLDQILAYQNGPLTEEQIRDVLGLGERVLLHDAFAALIEADLNHSLKTLKEIDDRGLDLKLFAEEILTCYRHLILLKATKTTSAELSPTENDFFKSLESKIDLSLLLAQYQILMTGIREIALSDYPKTVFEILLVKIHHAGQMLGLAELVDRLKPATMSFPKTIPNTRPENPKPVVGAGLPRPKNVSSCATTWYDLVQWITNAKPPLGSMLKEAVPVGFSDTMIEVAFAPQSASKGLLIERINTVHDLIEQHFGKKVEFIISDLIDGNLAGEKKKPPVVVYP